MRALETYLHESQSATEEQFVRKHAHPVLIYRGTAAFDHGDAPAVGFKTQVVKAHSLTDKARMLGTVEVGAPVVDTVFELCRGATSVYSQRVSVGRVSTNDVVIAYPRISKFHCYFTQEGELYALVDVGATNGTRVSGKRLAKGESMPVSDSTEIALGPYHFDFFRPKAFYASCLAKK